MGYGLDPLVQQRAMHQFAPRDISRDVSNMFCKFAQGVARSQELLFPGGSQAHAVREDQVDTSEFVNKWSLGPDAQAMLSGFIPDMQQKIMREFCPRDASQDCNNIFMKFAQSVSRGVKGGKGCGMVGGGYGKGFEKGYLAGLAKGMGRPY